MLQKLSDDEISNNWIRKSLNKSSFKTDHTENSFKYLKLGSSASEF
jgi:hypothetical protein